MLKKEKIKLKGLHCQSCKTMIETELDAMNGVKHTKVDYKTGSCEIEFDASKTDQKDIANKIKELGYSVDKNNEQSVKKTDNKQRKVKSKLLYFGLVLLFVSGYFIVSKLGGFELLAKLNEGQASYGLIFVIGLLAGFHCVGMCGGLVIAYSARQDNEKQKANILSSHLQYNVGRIISYTVIGGILGGLGSFFGINPMFTGIVLLVAGIIMVLMGLSFLTNWKVLEKIKIKTPKAIAKYIYKQKHQKNAKGPFIIGLLNGFMPCGPLQAVQLYALASGEIIKGAVVMSIYALGTSVLMLLFGLTVSSINKRHIVTFTKISGLLVLVLGLGMANRGLANFGYGINVIPGASSSGGAVIEATADFQEVKMDLTYLGYKPNVLYIKPDVPVRWIINVKEMTGCTDAIMIESLGIKKDLKMGENIIEFTPPKDVAEIKFSCWMRMVWGKFVVTKNPESSKTQSKSEEASLPPVGSCGGNCGSASCGLKTSGTCTCGR